MSRSFLFVLLALLHGLLVAQSERPVFVAGDPNDLKATVDAKATKAEHGLIAVRVHNRTKDWAEPLVFHVRVDVTEAEAGGRVREFFHHRSGYPYYGRAGRAVPPRGKAIYLIPKIWGEITPVSKLRIRVRHASFFRTRTKPVCPVTITERKEIEVVDDFTKERLDRTRLTFVNAAPHAVNIILRTGGGRGKKRWCGLAGGIIEAGATSTTLDAPILTDRETFRRAPGLSLLHPPGDRAEIVDWSVLEPTDPLPARNALARAWAARARIDLAAGEMLRGKVRATAGAGPRANADGHPSPVDLTFDFRVDHTGRVSVDISIAGGTPADAALRGLTAMFEPLVFPDLEERLEGHRPEIFEHDSTRGMLLCLRQTGEYQGLVRGEMVRIHDDAFVERRGMLAVNPSRVMVFTNERGPDGRWRPTTRRDVSRVNPVQPQVSATYRWTKWDDQTGWPRVLEGESSPWLGQEVTHFRLEVLELERVAAPDETGRSTPQAPRGPGVAALRRAWSKPYRYPGLDFDLEGSLDLRAAESSRMDWVNRDRIRGTIVLKGWRGLRNASNRAQKSLEFRPRKELSEPSRLTIENLLEARSTIYTRQDFAARATFGEEFRGCILGALKGGRIPVDGHTDLIAVTVKKGLPTALHHRDGTVHRYRFGKSRDGLVPTRTEWVQSSGHRSVIKTTYSAVRPGLQVPTKIEIEDWFGPDWGPEVYRYRFTSARLAEDG